MKILFSLTALFAVASAWSFSCPELSVVNDFNMTKFSGMWYNEYSRNTPLEAGSCLVSNYSYNSDTGVMDIASSLTSIFGTAETMYGTAKLSDSSSTEGNLKLTYSTLFGNFNFDLAVLSTDYENYVIMYSCTKILHLMPYDSTWILTREQIIDDAILIVIKEAMAEVANNGGPSFSELKQNSQTNCS